MNQIGDILRRNVDRYPDREAMVGGDTRHTWSEVDHRSNRVANGLLGLGVGKGDRVAHLLPNSPELAEILFGILKIGAVVVPVNYRLSSEEISTLLNDSGPKVLMYRSEHSSLIEPIEQKCRSIQHKILLGGDAGIGIPYETLLADSPMEEPPGNAGLDDLAYIAYTGGTTGLPKGAMWLHRTLLDTVQDKTYDFETAFKLKALFVAPFVAASSNIMLFNLAYAAATVFIQDFDPLNNLKIIEKERVELLYMSAVPLFMIASHPEAGNYDISSVKFIGFGGAGMTLDQLKKIKPFFRCPMQQRYGSTETLVNITTLQHGDYEVGEDPEKISRLQSAGRANKGVEIRLLDDSGRDVPLGDVG